MQVTMKKRAVVFTVILSIGLIFGNMLWAEDRAFDGVISAADRAFIEAGYTGARNSSPTAERPEPADLVSAADDAFMRIPFSTLSGSWHAERPSGSVGIITAADYRFLTAGQVEDLFSVYSDLTDSVAVQPGK